MKQIHLAVPIERFPATAAQKRFWFQEQANPGDVELNIAVRWEIRGTFREPDIESAFQQIVDRHEILRTRFVDEGGEPLQEVVESCAFRLGSVDLRAVPADQHEARVDAISRELGAQHFDLSQPCLFRVTMVSLAADRAALLIVAHHIVFDGFSIGVLGHELGMIMQGLNERRPPQIEELPLQFGDYALWEEELQTSDAMEEDGRYWENRLNDAGYFELKPDFPRPAIHTARGRTVTLAFPPNFDARMTEYCKQSSISIFTFGAACMGAALQRWSGQTDILFSVPVAGRMDVDIEKLIGVFVNTMVMRLRVQPGSTLQDHILGLKPVVQEALEHQAYPFDLLVRRIRRPRHPGRPHLVSLNLNMQRVFLQERTYGDFRMISVPSHMPGIHFDMNVQIVGRQSGWKIMLDYNEHLFREETAERFARLLQATMETALDRPTRRIVELPLDTDTADDQPPAVVSAVARPLDNVTEEISDIGAIEDSLRQIWSDLLRLPAEACNDDFFDIGGHSLHALRMLARVESRFGVKLPVAAFLSDSTLSGFSRALAGAMAAPAATAPEHNSEHGGWEIMSLRTAAEDAPVIVTVNQPFLYHAIARNLTSSCSVVNLSLRDREAFEKVRPCSFDQVAEQLSDLVRQNFAGRPVIALGHCVDALVALRMSQALANAGAPVFAVGMIDAWAPGAFPEEAEVRRRRKSHYLRQKLRGAIGWKDFFLKNRKTKQMLRRLGMTEPETETENLSRAVNFHLFDLSKVYRFAPYPGDVMLFKTDAQTPEADHLMFGWSGILADHTPIHAIRGWHEDALLHAGIDRMARILDSRVSSIGGAVDIAGHARVSPVRG